MLAIENECVGCPSNMPCIYEACRHYKTVHYYCDKCDEEADDLFKWNEEEWCLDCIINDLERVEYDE